MKDGKDFLDWVITGKEKACEALGDPCDLKEAGCNAIQETLGDLEKLACEGFSVNTGIAGQVTFGAIWLAYRQRERAR